MLDSRALLVNSFLGIAVCMCPKLLSHFLMKLTLLFKVTLYCLGGQKSHAAFAFPSRKEEYF